MVECNRESTMTTADYTIHAVSHSIYLVLYTPVFNQIVAGEGSDQHSLSRNASTMCTMSWLYWSSMRRREEAWHSYVHEALTPIPELKANKSTMRMSVFLCYCAMRLEPTACRIWSGGQVEFFPPHLYYLFFYVHVCVCELSRTAKVRQVQTASQICYC